METPSRPLVIEIRIPFCSSRCPHCDQPVLQADPSTRSLYTDALCRELTASAPDFACRRVQCVYFSGGSPTCLSQEEFTRLALCLQKHYDLEQGAEITVEALPNRLDAGWMVTFQTARVSRLALGLVTGHAGDAQRIGLPASPRSMENALILPQMFGLKSYEAQLLFGLPGQTEQSFEKSLRFAVRYHAPEILLSAWRPVGQPSAPLPGQAAIRRMMDCTARHLTEKGYTSPSPGYWVLPGHDCRFQALLNSGAERLGFGLGAESFTDGIRYKTTDRLGQYLYHSDQPDQIYTIMPQVP